MMTYERFLERLRAIRKERGYSLRALGAKIGVTAPQLSYSERGKSGLKVEDFLALCEAMEIDPKDVFDEGIANLTEYSVTAGALKKLSEREFRLIKDLIMLMSLDTEDL